MTYTITSQCISCDRCLSACPTHAIQPDGDRYWINPDLCNNCVGSYAVPQCWAACPTTNGCIPGLTDVFRVAQLLAEPNEYWDRWFDVYNRLILRVSQTSQDQYWQGWFALYSCKLATLMQSH